MYKSVRVIQWKSNWKNLYDGKSLKRLYNSGTGVYGHRPKERSHFQVSKEKLESRARNSNFFRLLTAFREHAHKEANIDPVSFTKRESLLELNPTRYGLNLTDRVSFENLFHTEKVEGSIGEAVEILRNIYCGNIGIEFTHLESEEEREWFAENYEKFYQETLSEETRRGIAKDMLKSQAFDNFLAVKFVTVKRYGGEGAESMMAFFREIFRLSSTELEHIVLCMPHRGRLNFLTGMLHFPPEKLFLKLRGIPEFPNDAKATGDVPSHFISSVDFNATGKSLHVSILPNPSHLEAVNPVSMGKTRAMMQAINDGDYSENKSSKWSDKVLNIQIHGDAAYVGQGINQESLCLSGVPHFEIGGTIHLVVNNQVGFTTPPSRGRSTRYCTDLAKFINAPVIHVNGDDPEMVVRATRIAFAYQRKFRKDVFVDLNCFRRWGHNELDDPTFTNPLLYKIIHNRPSVPDSYLEKLSELNVLSKEEGKSIVEDHTTWLANALRQTDNYLPEPTYFTGWWSRIKQADSAVTTWNTGVDTSLLQFFGNRSVQFDNGFNIHPHILKSHVKARLKRIESGTQIDWSTAEAMAFGSLLYQGYNVRLSGQDVGRGTFSHRHAMLVDQTSGGIFVPLNSMTTDQKGKLELANSILSEEAVLGFEYGVSITSPSTLAIWEAQFGDFFNGAQIIIDTFLTSGEAKWMLSSGLTMLLPHGYEGAGPEHSSCRMERFLQLTDSKENKPDGEDVNFQIAIPTTPAQYFHLLRRQMVRDFRKPLIVVTPKVLLRHSSAISNLSEMTPGTFFKTVIGDEKVQKNNVHKILFVSGKHYYNLLQQRENLGATNVAIIRIESLCPFPIMELLEEIEKYKHASTFVWSQEEPRNMGAWSFVKPRFENLCGRRLQFSGRESLPVPAVGVGRVHQQEAEEVIKKPFAIK